MPQQEWLGAAQRDTPSQPPRELQGSARRASRPAGPPSCGPLARQDETYDVPSDTDAHCVGTSLFDESHDIRHTAPPGARSFSDGARTARSRSPEGQGAAGSDVRCHQGQSGLNTCSTQYLFDDHDRRSSSSRAGDRRPAGVSSAKARLPVRSRALQAVFPGPGRSLA